MLVGLRQLWSGSFRARVLLATTLAVAVATVVFSVVGYFHKAGKLQEEHEARANRLMDLVGDSLSRPLFDFNSAAIDTAARALVAQSDIGRVIVADSAGSVLVDTGDDRVHGGHLFDLKRRITFHDHGREVYVGTAEIQFLEDTLQASLRSARMYALVNGIWVALLTTVILLLVLRKLIRPLDGIVGSLSELARGNTAIELSGASGNDEFGRMQTAVRMFRDAIIERQSALDVVLESEQRFQDFSASTADWFWEMDADLRFNFCSENVEQYSGLKPEALLGKTRYELLAQHGFNSEPTIAVHIAQLHQHLPFRDFEYRIHLDSGEIRWISVSGVPYFGSDGKFAGYRGVGRNITERKRLESELAIYRDNLEQLVEKRTADLEEAHRQLATTQFAMESVGIGIQWSDVETGRFVYVNRYAASLLGYTPTEMLQLRVSDIDPNVPPETYRRLRETIRQRGKMQFESVHRSREGRDVPVEVLVFYHQDSQDSAPRFIAFVTDITQRKENEQALAQAKTTAEAANAAKSRFLAAASHDLRQPMHAISLLLDALQRTHLNPQQEHIVSNLDASRRALGELLDALLDISRLDAGIVQPRPVLLDVFEIFRRIESEFSSVVVEKGLRFLLHFPRKQTLFHTDPKLLLGILRNLVSNAIRYTQRGGVLVSVRVRRSHLLFQVWDTGIGIPAEDVPRIFDEFYQVGNTERDRSKGLGLGLSIVQRLAHLMGYRIGCSSHLGRGSVFSINVPLDAGLPVHDGTPEVDAREEPSDVQELRGMQVVLIEDDALVARAWSGWLKSLGGDTEVFVNAREALASPAIFNADVYISDLRLPGDMNGLQLLSAIQDRVQRKIRGILVTGDTAVQQLNNMEEAGWVVLHKPVETSVLLSALLQTGSFRPQ